MQVAILFYHRSVIKHHRSVIKHNEGILRNNLDDNFEKMHHNGMRPILFDLCFLSALQLAAKERYIIYFSGKDKNAKAALGNEALARRAANQQQTDAYDLPVAAANLQMLRNNDVRIIRTSRWLNAALVETDLGEAQLAKLSAGIQNVQNVTAKAGSVGENKFIENNLPVISASGKTQNKTTAVSFGLATTQNLLLGIDHLHEKGFRGKGVKVAFLDAGYNQMDSVGILDSIFANNRIKATYDFWADTTYVFTSSDHGTSCASLMVGNEPGVFVGTAPDVDLMFALTDDLITETPQDEFNYVAALEWADSLGADIASVSLSYKDFDFPYADYTYSQMDGKTTISTQGAVIAARKGLMIVNGAGNSGFLCAPCDADSVLCVGGADSLRNYDFISSYGPTFDGRVKPDVAAQTAFPWYKNGNSGFYIRPFYSGTSIATPQIAGLAACLKQAHPNASNIQLINAIRQSAHRYNNPDAGTGYGVPNGRVADSLLDVMLNVKETAATINNVSIYPNPANDKVTIEADEMIVAVEIMSLDGKLLLAEPVNAAKTNINIQSLAPGFYLVELRGTSNVISYSKLVKQ